MLKKNGMKGAQGTEHKDHERTTKKSIVRP